MSVERLYITSGLRLRERAKGEGFSRNAEIGRHRIDELQKYSARRTPFVELACRVEIARSIARCRGDMMMRDERSSERADGLFHLG